MVTGRPKGLRWSEVQKAKYSAWLASPEGQAWKEKVRARMEEKWQKIK